MANRKSMAVKNSILTLWNRGWSQRRIARELCIHRETVGRYVRQEGRSSRGAGPAVYHLAGDRAPRSAGECTTAIRLNARRLS
jgi:IS30 family transposase